MEDKDKEQSLIDEYAQIQYLKTKLIEWKNQADKRQHEITKELESIK